MPVRLAFAALRNFEMSCSRFSKVVEDTRRTPQTVTKHGKPAVVALNCRCASVAPAAVSYFFRKRHQTIF
jgi:hypothetical protein